MKNILILGAGGQIARHVINQLADKQTIKQTLFARQPAKIHKPYPTNIFFFCGFFSFCPRPAADPGTGCCFSPPPGGGLSFSGNFFDRRVESFCFYLSFFFFSLCFFF